MTQTQRVAYLMTTDKTNQLAHQLLIKLHGLCTLVNGTTLYHIPFCKQIHHVVVPADMCLDNLARAWVNDAWTIGILCL